jgi:hypothetical protein
MGMPEVDWGSESDGILVRLSVSSVRGQADLALNRDGDQTRSWLPRGRFEAKGAFGH